MSTQQGQAVQEAVASREPESEPTLAEARRRARSITAAPGLPSEGSPALVTHSKRERAQIWVAQFSARVTANLAGPSLLHAQAPSLADQHKHHHEAAKPFRESEALLMRVVLVLRVGWGYLHLAIKAVLHVIDWVTASFPRLLVAAGIWAALKFWLWRGLP